MKTILALILALSIQTAKADPGTGEVAAAELEAIQGSLDSRNEFVQAVRTKDFSHIAHDVFGLAVQEMAQDLRDRGDDEMANGLLDQWNQTQNAFFVSMKDLGDHAPLFQWLDDFFKKLEAKYGSIVMNLPYVKDLITLNFAIPVTFKPHGTWQVSGVDSRIEYRKHFIPFANIVTYYGSLYGCKYVMAKHGLSQIGGKLCPKAADKLKFEMGRYIAPPISDWVFRQANRQESGQWGRFRMTYTTATDLQNAVQRN